MWGKAKDLENALDECLAGLAQGESLEACLARFPRLRQELEPLLRAAQAVRRSAPRAAPPADALVRARNRFLAEAARRRQVEATARRRVALPRLAPVFQRGLATAVLVVMLTVVILGTGSIVSANSLPGDPLYGVKRASERVRLFLTLDAETRANLERYYEALRVAEVKQVVEQGRQVQVDLAGTVERVEGDMVVVEGIPVRLPEAAAADAPAVGSKVEIVGQTHEDGTVTVKALAVRATPVVTAVAGSAPAPASTATVPVEQRPTAKPTSVPTEKPTAKPEPTATPTAVPTAQPSATAPAPTATASPSATATRTSTATTTPVPPPREIVVRIEGRIDAITSQSWVVNGQRVTLRASTQINQTAAQGQVGGWAIVEAVQKADGQLVARQIIVVRGPQQPPEVREFSGAIESFSATRWVVAGQTLEIVSDTVIEGTPTVGAVAHVQAEHHADGRLVAKRIIVQSPQETVVRFEGLITAFGEERWVVAGQELWLTAQTQIEGRPEVGAIAQVEAVLRQDGALEARRIVILAGAPSGPAQTATPAPTQALAVPEAKEVIE